MTAKAFSELKGLTLVSVHGAEPGSDRVVFLTTEGRIFSLYHSQDCCESVTLLDVCGDVDDVCGAPLWLAEESSNCDDAPPEGRGDDSNTWTFYRMACSKGAVTLRWFGSSNGYYSESVDFFEETP